MLDALHRRRDFHNPSDPFFRKLGYSYNNKKTLRTGKMLGIIKPHDH